MKKNLILTAAVAMFAFAASAQTAITPDVLKKLSEQPQTAADKAIRNALSSTSLTTLATDASTLKEYDTRFAYRVPTKGITNQLSSGRCWLFTGLNVLRAKAITRWNLPKLELSQGYLFFFDQLEKSNLFLQGIIDTAKKPYDDRMVDWLFSNPLSDGGTFTGVVDLVMKYGVVPKEIMPETFQTNNTSALTTQLKTILREDGIRLREMAAKGANAKKLEAEKVKMIETVYRILTLGFGVPPTEFTWTRRDAADRAISTKTYTPQSFYQEFWGDDMNNDYVLVMNDPMREYYKVYQIEFDRHTYDGHDWVYLNLPIDEIKPMAMASIQDSTAMYISCDVGKYLIRDHGVLDVKNFDYESILGVKFGMNKKERITTHASGSSHAMTLIAVDINEKGEYTKWMVENSWGEKAGWRGNLIMTDEWFNEYMFRFVLNKKYVTEKYKKMYEQKPIMLPAWDPMFAVEE